MRAETNNLLAAGGYVGVKYLENLGLNQRGSLAWEGEDFKC